MKYDCNLSQRETEILKALVGKRLVSYRLNDTDNTSFEIFVLRFPALDIELATREIIGLGNGFDETNTVEVVERPNRDSWSRVGKTEPDNGIPEGQFKDYAVGQTVTGVSTIVETFRRGKDSIVFVRGLDIDLGDTSIVFDKGAYNWASIWRVTQSPSSSIALAAAEFDPIEEPGSSSRTSIDRLA